MKSTTSRFGHFQGLQISSLGSTEIPHQISSYEYPRSVSDKRLSSLWWRQALPLALDMWLKRNMGPQIPNTKTKAPGLRTADRTEFGRFFARPQHRNTLSFLVEDNLRTMDEEPLTESFMENQGDSKGDLMNRIISTCLCPEVCEEIEEA